MLIVDLAKKECLPNLKWNFSKKIKKKVIFLKIDTINLLIFILNKNVTESMVTYGLGLKVIIYHMMVTSLTQGI